MAMGELQVNKSIGNLGWTKGKNAEIVEIFDEKWYLCTFSCWKHHQLEIENSFGFYSLKINVEGKGELDNINGY